MAGLPLPPLATPRIYKPYVFHSMDTPVAEIMHSISCEIGYRGYSVEELRLNDYKLGLRSASSAPPSQASSNQYPPGTSSISPHSYAPSHPPPSHAFSNLSQTPAAFPAYNLSFTAALAAPQPYSLSMYAAPPLSSIPAIPAQNAFTGIAAAASNAGAAVPGIFGTFATPVFHPANPGACYTGGAPAFALTRPADGDLAGAPPAKKVKVEEAGSYRPSSVAQNGNASSSSVPSSSRQDSTGQLPPRPPPTGQLSGGTQNSNTSSTSVPSSSSQPPQPPPRQSPYAPGNEFRHRDRVPPRPSSRDSHHYSSRSRSNSRSPSPPHFYAEYYTRRDSPSKRGDSGSEMYVTPMHSDRGLDGYGGNHGRREISPETRWRQDGYARNGNGNVEARSGGRGRSQDMGPRSATRDNGTALPARPQGSVSRKAKAKAKAQPKPQSASTSGSKTGRPPIAFLPSRPTSAPLPPKPAAAAAVPGSQVGSRLSFPSSNSVNAVPAPAPPVSSSVCVALKQNAAASVVPSTIAPALPQAARIAPPAKFPFVRRGSTIQKTIPAAASTAPLTAPFLPKQNGVVAALALHDGNAEGCSSVASAGQRAAEIASAGVGFGFGTPTEKSAAPVSGSTAPSAPAPAITRAPLGRDGVVSVPAPPGDGDSEGAGSIGSVGRRAVGSAAVGGWFGSAIRRSAVAPVSGSTAAAAPTKPTSPPLPPTSAATTRKQNMAADGDDTISNRLNGSGDTAAAINAPARPPILVSPTLEQNAISSGDNAPPVSILDTLASTRHRDSVIEFLLNGSASTSVDSASSPPAKNNLQFVSAITPPPSRINLPTSASVFGSPSWNVTTPAVRSPNSSSFQPSARSTSGAVTASAFSFYSTAATSFSSTLATSVTGAASIPSPSKVPPAGAAATAGPAFAVMKQEQTDPGIPAPTLAGGGANAAVSVAVPVAAPAPAAVPSVASIGGLTSFDATSLASTASGGSDVCAIPKQKSIIPTAIGPRPSAGRAFAGFSSGQDFSASAAHSFSGQGGVKSNAGAPGVPATDALRPQDDGNTNSNVMPSISSARHIPLSLLHPIFGEFIDDMHNLTPTTREIQFLKDISEALAAPAMTGSMTSLVDLFVGLLKEQFGIAFVAKSSANPWLISRRAEVSGRPFIMIDVLDGSSTPIRDPFILNRKAYEGYVSALSGDLSSLPVLPCLHILFSGPFISFAGSAMAAGSHRFEIMTSAIPLACHTTWDDDLKILAARSLGAMANAADRLKAYYAGGVQIPSQTLRSPYCTVYRRLERNFLATLRLDKLVKPDKLLYYGQEDHSVPVLVQFVRKFSRELHELCCSYGRAPALRAIEKLPGGWFMVVTDRPDSDLIVSVGPLPVSVRTVVEEFVKVVNGRGFVLDDEALSADNVWYDPREDGRFVLVEMGMGNR